MTKENQVHNERVNLCFSIIYGSDDSVIKFLVKLVVLYMKKYLMKMWVIYLLVNDLIFVIVLKYFRFAGIIGIVNVRQLFSEFPDGIRRF
jgi:hypothetical protein